MTPDILSQLAPAGILRAAINMGNRLMVSGAGPSGVPIGVAPDMAAAAAERLGVKLVCVPYESPALMAAVAESGDWDIALIGADPARAEKIAFTAAYCEIEVTYLVPADSPLKNAAEVDRAGIRIATLKGAPFTIWLESNIKHASLIMAGRPASDRFFAEKLDALADLKPDLLANIGKFPGYRILDGAFTSVQQAIGTPRKNEAGAAFLRDFVEEAKASGLVRRLLEKHAAHGLSVAPKA